MRIRWIGALALTLALIGCGKEQTETPPPPTTPPSASTGVPPPGANAAAPATSAVTMESLDKVSKADKPYTIVLIVKTRNNPFFKPMIDSFIQTVKELGATPVVEAPPQEQDKEKQFALVQTEISQGVNAICIAPADSKAIVPALKTAQDKGIVVVNLDNRVDPEAAKAQG